mgnify:CR=1 FL=1|tara:strand:- start:1102 stop:1338 length:237 start_codon:yes stop_codon:yes gene_type:complete
MDIKIFQSQDRQGRLLQVDMDDSSLEEKLENWLIDHNQDVYWDIEFNEGGKIIIGKDYIDFSGDNGFYNLEEILIEKV